MLDLAAVEPDKRNIRRGGVDDAEVETLRVALRTALERGQEFDHPITVYSSGAKRYTIKHGHRRYAAARLEGVPRLHFHIVPRPSERERILDQLDDNLNARSLSPMDLARAFDELRKIDNLSISQLVQALRDRGVPGVEKGESAGREWVRQHLDLLKLHPEVQELVQRRQLGYSVAVKLKDQPRGQQAALARRIVSERMSTREVDVVLGRRPTDDSEPRIDEPEFDSQGLSGRADADSVEARLASFRDELADRAAAQSGHSPRTPARYDPHRRHSAVESRVEFFGTAAPPSPVDAKARQRLEALNASEWAAHASDGALTIARDLVNWGRRSNDEGMQLAERCMAALRTCPEDYVRLMHTIRLAVERAHEGLPDPLGVLLDLWVEQIPRHSQR